MNNSNIRQMTHEKRKEGDGIIIIVFPLGLVRSSHFLSLPRVTGERPSGDGI